MADGSGFWLGRDGEAADGSFGEARSYDASRSPYHLRLERWPAGSGASCASSPSCETTYGLNGTWIVRSVTAPASGTFIFSALTHDKGCWVEQPGGPPDLGKCTLLGGSAYGCFKVD